MDDRDEPRDGYDDDDDHNLVTTGSGENAPKFENVIVLPLEARPLFPGTVHPVYLRDKTLIHALDNQVGNTYVGAFLQRQHRTDALRNPPKPETMEELHEIGTFASVSHIHVTPNGAQVLLHGHRRIRALEEIASDPLMVKVDHLDDPKINPDDDLIKAYSMEMMSTMKELLTLNPLFTEQLQKYSERVSLLDSLRLADFGAALTTADPELLQSVLEEQDPVERLQKALTCTKRELELTKLQQTISKQVEEKVTKQHRDFMLREQLKTIKKELGMEKDDKETLIQKFKDRLADKTVPEKVDEVISEEMDKLSSLDKNSSEFNVTRSYLDWLSCLPWGIRSEENFDIPEARRILDEDHYGLEDVKDRILEFIAVGKLKGTVQGKIICLVGPPGVGKTSIGHSIARALGVEFARFSVGGLTDVAEIKGHRRTYVGAMPGKIVQSLKKCQTENPLILIDEIDKLGRGHTGDPASALLELLDPSQNEGFLDHYLDVPLDTSQILFVCTANVLDTIPEPLKDRMEIIRLSGYVADEKLAIAQNYLIPDAQEASGLNASNSILGESAIKELVRWYCREAGVRQLKQHIEKVFRKIAYKIVAEDASLVHVDAGNLKDFVGNSKFTSDRVYDVTPPGVVMGLAWTSMGGSTLYIESCAVVGEDGKGLEITGQLGDVMKESTTIAYTVAKRLAGERGVDFFEKHRVHLHVPEGATPKDGPSAGCTMVTSLLSLALDKKVKPDVAMTGEITLTGKVLPVGGIKEKTIAAKRSFAKQLYFPKDNEKDFNELPDNIKEGVSVTFVSQYEEILEGVFEEIE